MHTQQNLVRKQFLVSQEHVEKLATIAFEQKTSSAEIVRLAIDAYDPDMDVDIPELMALVSERLKEAIQSTQLANQHVADTLNKIESRQQ